MKTVLITGGARSGKSSFAQEMAARGAPGGVLFVATAQAGDEEMRRRIEVHRRNRPPQWRTLEAPVHVGVMISAQIGAGKTVLLDCITLLLNNVMAEFLSPDGTDIDETRSAQAVNEEIEALVHCIRNTPADFIVVTNEVGLGLVPDNKLGRVYRDLLGRANQVLAGAADEVYFMVSGLPLKLKP